MKTVIINGKEIKTNLGGNYSINNKPSPSRVLKIKNESLESDEEFVERLANEGYTTITLYYSTTCVKGYYNTYALCKMRDKDTKKYIIKDTIMNIKTNEVQVYYTGKDGYVHDFPEYADGYSRIHFAKAQINKSNDYPWILKIDEMHSIESDNWHHTYEIIEVDE